MIVTSLTLLSKSLSSCDSHLHTNTDLLASWKFFWCVCVCVFVAVHVHSLWEAWQIQEPDFLTAHSQNNQALGREPQLKYSFLRKRKADGAKKISSVLPPPVQPLAGNGHLLTCEQLRYYRASQTSGSNIIPTDSAALCCFDLVYTHTLTSPPARAGPLPFYPHSRGCERNNKLFQKVAIISRTLCSVDLSNKFNPQSHTFVLCMIWSILVRLLNNLGN